MSDVRASLCADEPALAGLERRFGGELLADVVENGEDGGLGAAR